MVTTSSDTQNLPALKILSLCSADSGGAGIAALRQHDALNKYQDGCNTHFVAHQKGRHEGVHVVPSRQGHVVPVSGAAQEAVQTAYLAYSSYLAKQLSGYTPLPGAESFSVPYHCVDPSTLPFFEDYHAINLHWVAGMFDPARLPTALAGRPVVWTLHDMNPFTGGCHYTDGCVRFTEHCGACPQLQSTNIKDLSFQTWRDRMTAYRTLNLHIVTPSQWLADEARTSSLLGRFPITVIPNCVPVDRFRPLNRETIRQGLNIASDQTVLLFSSQSLYNLRKGTKYLLEALRCIAEHEMGKRALVMLLGNNPPQEFLHCGLCVEVMGHVDTEEHIALLYNAADAVIVPSLEDNLPNVIIEAAACGTPVVAFAAGGIPEMIRHQETGWLAALRSVAALCEGIVWADAVRGNTRIRQHCRILALEQWNPARLAGAYRALFENLCGV